jgi:hypothetical protein
MSSVNLSKEIEEINIIGNRKDGDKVVKKGQCNKKFI